MKVTLRTNPPIPVKPTITGVILELTPVEAELLAENVWCGPKADNALYFSVRAGRGMIGHDSENAITGAQLRDLLRDISTQLARALASE